MRGCPVAGCHWTGDDLAKHGQEVMATFRGPNPHSEFAGEHKVYPSPTAEQGGYDRVRRERENDLARAQTAVTGTSPAPRQSQPVDLKKLGFTDEQIARMKK
jgi:hypothetical protein